MDIKTKNSLSAQDFAGKVAIFDMDGVLLPHMFNGHIAPVGGGYKITEAEYAANAIELTKPCKHVQNILNSIDTKLNVAISGIMYQAEDKVRYEWLRDHYKNITRVIFLSKDCSKVIAIQEFCEKAGIDLKDVIYIDDELYACTQAEMAGINSWHVSSLMDFYEDK